MSCNPQTSTLPQGFSVFQPTLGAQLQFFPTIGTRELDELVSAYVPGSASVQEKRASISLDFFQYAHMTGQTFKFYPVYSMATPVESPATASPLQDSGYGSSFNASPVMSNWDWSQINAAPSSRRQSPKAGSSQQQAADFSHIPGMKIMTKDGLDVTNSASRGSKTKEQRDHAHLMRIIKACESCKKKKIRCDPSHKKRGVTHSQAQPAKVAKKAKASEPRAVPVVFQDDLAASLAFPAEETFSTTELDSLAASATAGCELWEEFIQYPPVEDYDFFCDPEGYLSPESSLSAYSTKSVTPTSQEDHPGTYSPVNAEVTVPSANLPFNEIDSVHNYVDFNLFSPESSFSEDDQMVPIELSRHVVNQPRSQAPNPLPTESFGGSGGSSGGLTGDLLDTQLATTLSAPQLLLSAGDLGSMAKERDPGAGLEVLSSSASSRMSPDVLSHSTASIEETPYLSVHIPDHQSDVGIMSPSGGSVRIPIFVPVEQGLIPQKVAINHNSIVDPNGTTLQSVCIRPLLGILRRLTSRKDSTFANVSRTRRPGTSGLDQFDTGRHAERVCLQLDLRMQQRLTLIKVIIESVHPQTTLSSVELQSPVATMVATTELSSGNVAAIANANVNAIREESTPLSSSLPSSELSSSSELSPDYSGGDTLTSRRDPKRRDGSTCRDRAQHEIDQANNACHQCVVDASEMNSAAAPLSSGTPDQYRTPEVLNRASSTHIDLETNATATVSTTQLQTQKPQSPKAAKEAEVAPLPCVLYAISAVSSGLLSPCRGLCLTMVLSTVVMLAAITAWSNVLGTQSKQTSGKQRHIPRVRESGTWAAKATSFVTSIRGMVEGLQRKSSTGTKPVVRMVSQSRRLIAV
ncbi:hypothetical protein FZEAL_8383 [Fusarium zealandicum]|uniref:Transcription factor n=1 Tax=Fusarium zealandicum TaxID=1053134 RepID=A0A8H4XGX4_9HYPO|nr:hypothetical protein FZEAL_8383 [Fusarium zealandicum]